MNMPQVTITLTDTPEGGVAVQSDFKPAIGAPCSAAQAAALDIFSRTRKHYGLDAKPTADQAFAMACETARQAREDKAEGLRA
jgi:hypothetical protein